jgi:hypothetical protein
MKIKTNKLTGAALDWAVAKCEGHSVFIKHAPVQIMYTPKGKRSWYIYTPSTNWSQSGPIIEREGIELLCNTSALQAAAYKNANPDWFACLKFKRADHWHGTTPLIAAMRCYVASKLGDNIDIPEELK